jgi:hypothetical protein
MTVDTKYLLDRIAELEHGPSQIRWCDAGRLRLENAAEVSPGGFLNQFGWWIVATTIGGNAIVVGREDQAIYFADHTWYHEDLISYQDLAGEGEWIDLPFTAEDMKRSLYQLAESPIEFQQMVASGDLDRILDRID